jgi:hypothetical protein
MDEQAFYVPPMKWSGPCEACAAKDAETQDLIDDLAAKLREVGELRERIAALEVVLGQIEVEIDHVEAQDAMNLLRLIRAMSERALRGEGE